jgi:hypothetical protein
MNKPQKYKSISVSDIKLIRRAISLTNTEKTQSNLILQKLTELIKLQHS